MKPCAIQMRGGLWMVHSPYGCANGMHFGIGKSLDEAMLSYRNNVVFAIEKRYENR